MTSTIRLQTGKNKQLVLYSTLLVTELRTSLSP